MLSRLQMYAELYILIFHGSSSSMTYFHACPSNILLIYLFILNAFFGVVYSQCRKNVLKMIALEKETGLQWQFWKLCRQLCMWWCEIFY